MARSDWRAGFKRALIDVLVQNGQLLKSDPYQRTYGWADYSAQGQRTQKRIRNGADIDYEASTWEESSWEEFMGTFYEGDTRVKGIDLRLVLKTKEEFNWRWSGSVGELIQQVVNEAGR